MKHLAVKHLLMLGAAAVIVTACSRPATVAPSATSASAAAPSIQGIPAGDYRIDPPHASLTFEVGHMGYSHYTARFTDFDAGLTLDPVHPENAVVTAAIDPQSLALNAPPKGFHDQLMGKDFFDAATFPGIKFNSTRVEMTGANTARVTGNLTLHGVTHPVTLDVVFNGGYPGMAMDPHARIGFSARGQLKRSDFGMGFGVPPAGSNMGVSDAVDFQIEAEFTGPPLVQKD